MSSTSDRKPARKVNCPGQHGKIDVLSENHEKSWMRYNCRCVCGAVTPLMAPKIFEYADTGMICHDCRMKLRRDQMRNHIGERHGQLVVTDVYYDSSQGKSIGVCRCDCGQTKEIMLSRVLCGQALTCGHDRDTYLRDGKDKLRTMYVDGTCVAAMQQKLSKNSTTGVKGVSCMHFKNGIAYRAYINFRRKQYHLGVYSKLEDAAKARAEAEERIYGDFIEWWTATYNSKEEAK